MHSRPFREVKLVPVRTGARLCRGTAGMGGIYIFSKSCHEKNLGTYGKFSSDNKKGKGRMKRKVVIVIACIVGVLLLLGIIGGIRGCLADHAAARDIQRSMGL